LAIAGRTAPRKRICIRGNSFGFYPTHDLLIRFLRARPGNISGETLDGMEVSTTIYERIVPEEIGTSLVVKTRRSVTPVGWIFETI